MSARDEEKRSSRVAEQEAFSPEHRDRPLVVFPSPPPAGSDRNKTQGGGRAGGRVASKQCSINVENRSLKHCIDTQQM